MDLGNIVGQLLKEGLSPQTQSRVEHAVGDNGLGGMLGGADLGSLLGSVMGGQQNQAGGSGLGDLLGSVGGMLAGNSGVGDMNRGQVGGIGALAGALLGGGGGAVKGALGGSAMALLGTLALSALKNSGGSGEASSANFLDSISEEDVAPMAAPDTPELCLRGMMEAIKSDGEISQAELDRLVSKLEEGGITAEEKRFFETQMSSPADPDGLIAAIPDQQTGVQVYASALLAIAVDTPEEKQFLDNLAAGIGLDGPVRARLHQMVGAPSA